MPVDSGDGRRGATMLESSIHPIAARSWLPSLTHPSLYKLGEQLVILRRQRQASCPHRTAARSASWK